MKQNKLLKSLLVSLVFGLGACSVTPTSSSTGSTVPSLNSSGSSSSISNTTSNGTQVPNSQLYKVTWVVDDQTFVENYYEGETPVYKFGTEKDSDETYSYTFSGWDKLITPVTEDVTYTALYHEEYINYTYTWVVDGVETTETYHYGDEVSYKGETPTKEGNEQYEYTFTGWDKELGSVTGDETVVAQFDREVRQYDVTFDVDGVKTTETYYYGELPEYEGTPTRESTEDYTYTFVGWNNKISPVTGDTTYTAVFEEKLIETYTVNFYDYAGNLLYNTSLKGGNVPVYEGDIPTIKDSKNNTYEFAGWLDRSTNTAYDSELPVIDRNTDFYAYSEELGILVINLFEDGELKSSTSQEVMNNDSYSYTTPSNTGFVANYDYVSGSMNLSATYNIYYSEVDKWNGSSVSSSFVGEGTEESPYLISSAADLAYLKNQVASGNTYKDSYFKMTKSVDLNGANFVIGSFAGHFDGDVYSIRGLAINKTSANTGLFSTLLNGGTISNVTTYGTITGAGVTGSIVGESNGTVSNCTNYAQVKGNGQRGGIIGYAYAPIINCVNYGKVISNTSGWNVGGIAGQTIDNIINCVNNGEVEGATSVGGIFGETTDGTIITVEGCMNNGKITGTWGVGGVCGHPYGSTLNDVRNYGAVNGTGQVGGLTGKGKGTISESYNYGAVVSSTATGGIGGEISGGYILKCANYGAISYGDRTGGIVGQFNGLEVSDCVNYGVVTGTNTSGGIMGKTWNSNRATITNCENNGTVYGSAYNVGGIFGTADVCDISNCTNNGDIISTSDCIGGIAGSIYEGAVIDNCYNNGNITGTNNLGGLLFTNRGTIKNCTNSGNITVTSASGTANGTIHTDSSGKSTNCTSTGEIIKN